MAKLFSWATGEEIHPADVEGCFVEGEGGEVALNEARLHELSEWCTWGRRAPAL